MANFLFHVPSGEPVSLEPFHYAIIGQTQFSGKTTLIKRLSDWAATQGFKVLIFDTKETEADYAGFGNEVPVCLRETTDSFVLIGLLESMFKRRLTHYYATLSRITERAKGFDDIIANARQLEEKTRSSWLKDACRVLYDLLERLKRETAKVETVPKLKLYPGINRMCINEFSLEAQQLIVRNAFEDALRFYKRKLILVIDEAFKFLPQDYSSPATRAVMNVITQGAKTGLYVWISTQFLAVTDKDPLKACAVKFLGTQDHITEVRHTLDLIPEARGKFKADDIMRLKLGHWVLVRKRPPFVGIVYSLPVGVPEDVGRKVALGEYTPEFVRDNYLKKMEVDEDLVWKEKFETLKKDFEKLKAECNRLKEVVKALRSQNEEMRRAGFDKYNQEMKKLKDENRKLKQMLDSMDDELEALELLRSGLSKLFNIPDKIVSPGFEPAVSGPSEVTVTLQQPALTVKVERKPLVLSQKDLLGRIAIVYAEGLLPTDKAFTLRQLNQIMEQRFGRKEAYANFSKPLTDLVAWGFLEKVRAGKRWDYRVKLKPSEAREKGLLKSEVERK